MEDYINESAETQEVAEPELDVEESAETQEVAEPDTAESTTEESSGKTAQDAAFAEQRRRIQELEEQLHTSSYEHDLMMSALSRYFDGETAEELSINANAYAEEVDPEVYRETFEHDREFDRLQAENQSLHDQLIDAQVERLMREGLREVQEIDPNVKSLEELGDKFSDFIRAGLPTKEAYYATKAMELKEKIFAPDAIGKVSDTKAERDYYTSAELDALTDEEMDANWDKVMRSLSRI